MKRLPVSFLLLIVVDKRHDDHWSIGRSINSSIERPIVFYAQLYQIKRKQSKRQQQLCYGNETK